MKLKVGHRLLIAREDRKLNQAEMADFLGLSNSAYARLERNETAADLDQLVKISKSLQIPIQDFLPETFSIHSTNQNGHSHVGLLVGNIYNYSDREIGKELEMKDKEINTLKEIVDLLKQQLDTLTTKKSEDSE